MDLDDLMHDAKCDVCDEAYDSENRKPKMLPCGHTYCQLCLNQIKERGDLKCPNCRKVHCFTVNDLPLNFFALHISERVQQQKETEICLAHNEEKRFWCTSCNVPLCGLCIFEKHHGDEHKVEKFADYLKGRQSLLGNEFEGIAKTTTALQHSVDSFAMDNIIRLLLASKYAHAASEFVSDVTEYQERLKTCKRVTLLESLEDSVKSSQEKITKLTSSFEKMRNGSNIRDPRTLNEASLYVSPQYSKYTGIAVSSDDGRYALLSWEGNKLHITSFGSEGADSDLIIKWSFVSRIIQCKKPKVFLELSVDGNYLGRIYIVLWGHLRRAQHFMALCLGTLGPTYSGSSLLEVRSAGTTACLIGGSYIRLDGSVDTKGLMDNLEWGGDHQGNIRKGLLVAFSGGKAQLDAYFGIAIETNEKTVGHCPFGEVISGLEVLKKASQYKPITKVNISRSGVILPLLETDISTTNKNFFWKIFSSFKGNV